MMGLALVEPVTVRLDVPHTEGTSYHAWAYIHDYRGTKTVVQRDSLGRMHRHAFRDWLVLICNNQECAGRAIVALDAITGAAELALPTSHGGR